MIKNGEGRFGGAFTKAQEADKKKLDSPAPTTYDIEGSFSYANNFRGREPIGKSKRVSFCESAAKLNISPGPSKHVTSIRLLDKLSPSPQQRSRKRF